MWTTTVCRNSVLPVESMTFIIICEGNFCSYPKRHSSLRAKEFRNYKSFFFKKKNDEFIFNMFDSVKHVKISQNGCLFEFVHSLLIPLAQWKQNNIHTTSRVTTVLRICLFIEDSYNTLLHYRCSTHCSVNVKPCNAIVAAEIMYGLCFLHFRDTLVFVESCNNYDATPHSLYIRSTYWHMPHCQWMCIWVVFVFDLSNILFLTFSYYSL